MVHHLKIVLCLCSFVDGAIQTYGSVVVFSSVAGGLLKGPNSWASLALVAWNLSI